MLRVPHVVLEDVRAAYVHPVDDRLAAHHLERIMSELDLQVTA